METANAPSTQKIVLLRRLSVAARIAGSILVGIALLWGFLLFFHGAAQSRFEFLHWASGFEQSLASALRRRVPVRFGGHDLSHWMVILATFMLGRFLFLASERSRDKADYLRFQSDYERWKREYKIADNATILSPVKDVLEQLQSGQLKDRDQLLKVFGATKKKLDEIGRTLAFLSVDVVDSTGIKSGEEKAAVEHDFHEYKCLAESIFVQHGLLKSAWTPDGAMCCFATVEKTAAAAKELIAALPNFNSHTKTMQRDFAVRCGINAGYVHVANEIPLEEVSDRVLDIAAHLQRRAEPNSICITEETAELLHSAERFTPTAKTVLGHAVYEWRAS
jgi:class 3 adenylate cyclase